MSADRPRSSDDEEFDRIVAGLELSVPVEDDRDDPPARDEPADVFDPRLSDPLEPDDDRWDDPSDAPSDDSSDDDARYVPDLEPAPPLDTAMRIAWAGMVGAPAVLVVATVIGYSLPRGLAATLVLVAVASLVFLIVRRGNEDTGAGPDHGARL